MANPIDFDAPELQQREFVINLREIVSSKIVRFLMLFLTSWLVLLGFFMRAFLENMNYVEVFPHEILFPVLLNAATAFVVAAIISVFKKRSLFAKSVAVVLLSLFMVNYDTRLGSVAELLKAIFPFLSSGDALGYVSIVFIITLACGTIFLAGKVEQLVARQSRIKRKDFSLALAVLVLYLFVVPLITFTQIMSEVTKQARAQSPALGRSSNQAEKPDIYYIVLDRYTNNHVLATQFNFDNAAFTSYLEQNKFYVNKNAYGNYPYTAMSIASTLSADYLDRVVEPHKDDTVQSRTLYHNLIWNSQVINALQEAGYEYHSIGSRYGTTYKAPKASIEYIWNAKIAGLGTAKRLRGIEMYEFLKSPFRRLFELRWSPLKLTQQDDIAQAREQIKALRDISEKPSGGRFVFAHILVPHDPFIFNADGSYSTRSGVDSLGRPIKDKYVGQVQFINNQMQQIIDTIQKRSNGQAVILLNSDEGPYPQSMNDSFLNPQSHYKVNEAIANDEDMRTWSDDWLKMKFGIQQAVHIPRATAEDLQNLSSVNLFRVVLNRYAGQSLTYLPQCHYGISNGTKREFNFVDITRTFESLIDESCSQKQSLPSR